MTLRGPSALYDEGDEYQQHLDENGGMTNDQVNSAPGISSSSSSSTTSMNHWMPLPPLPSHGNNVVPQQRPPPPPPPPPPPGSFIAPPSLDRPSSSSHYHNRSREGQVPAASPSSRSTAAPHANTRTELAGTGRSTTASTAGSDTTSTEHGLYGNATGSSTSTAAETAAYSQTQPQPAAQAGDARDWILTIRVPAILRLESAAPVLVSNSNAPSASDIEKRWTLRRLHMPSSGGMTVETLSACLQQILDDASAAHSNSNSSASTHRRLAGLYCEATGTFVSLHYLVTLTDPQCQALVYSVEPPLPPATPVSTSPKQSWHRRIVNGMINRLAGLTAGPFFTTRGVAPVVAILAIVYWHWETIPSHWDMLVLWSTQRIESLYEALIEAPLHDLYRHGPWFLAGWEGLDEALMCARITGHGDMSYWSHTTAVAAECRSIVQAKQTAWLLVARPVLTMLWAVVLLVTIRCVLGLYYVYQQIRNMNNRQPHPEMAQVYQAVHVLARQFQQPPQHA